MRCKQARDAISFFLDDQRDPTGQSRLNRLLEGCSECAAYLEDLREGLGMLHEMDLEEPSRNFEWNLRRKIQDAVLEHRLLERRAPAFSFWPRFALSAAAALLLSLGGASLWYAGLDDAPTQNNSHYATGSPQLGEDEGSSLPLTPGGEIAGPVPGVQPVGGAEHRVSSPQQRGTIQSADSDLTLPRTRFAPGEDRSDSLARDATDLR